MNKKYFNSILLFLVVGLAIVLVSCNPASKYEKAEKQSISNYLNSHVLIHLHWNPVVCIITRCCWERVLPPSHMILHMSFTPVHFLTEQYLIQMSERQILFSPLTKEYLSRDSMRALSLIHIS